MYLTEWITHDDYLERFVSIIIGLPPFLKIKIITENEDYRVILLCGISNQILFVDSGKFATEDIAKHKSFIIFKEYLKRQITFIL